MPHWLKLSLMLTLFGSIFYITHFQYELRPSDVRDSAQLFKHATENYQTVSADVTAVFHRLTEDVSEIDGQISSIQETRQRVTTQMETLESRLATTKQSASELQQQIQHVAAATEEQVAIQKELSHMSDRLASTASTLEDVTDQLEARTH